MCNQLRAAIVAMPLLCIGSIRPSRPPPHPVDKSPGYLQNESLYLVVVMENDQMKATLAPPSFATATLWTRARTKGNLVNCG
jgi:hypothetical protein